MDIPDATCIQKLKFFVSQDYLTVVHMYDHVPKCAAFPVASRSMGHCIELKSCQRVCAFTSGLPQHISTKALP